MEIGKEIKLKHKAPVVSIFVVDKEGMPLLGDVVEDQGKGKCYLEPCNDSTSKLSIVSHGQLLVNRNSEKRPLSFQNLRGGREDAIRMPNSPKISPHLLVCC